MPTEGPLPIETASEDIWVRSVLAGTEAIYAQPGIGPACLELQDRDGLCIPTMFCVLFASAVGGLPAADDLAAMSETLAPQRGRISELRLGRRARKPGPGATAEAMASYIDAQTRELEAEFALMTALLRRLHAAMEGGRGADATDAMERAIHSLGYPSHAGRRQLRVIADAVLRYVRG